MWLPAALTNARNTRFSLVVRKGSPRLSSLSSEGKVEAVNEPPTIVISQIVFMLEEDRLDEIANVIALQNPEDLIAGEHSAQNGQFLRVRNLLSFQTTPR